MVVSLTDFYPTPTPSPGNVTADQAAFEAAFAYIMSSRRGIFDPSIDLYPTSSIFVPPGDYIVYGGFGATLAAVGLWCEPNSVTITLVGEEEAPSDLYFLELAGRTEYTFISGFQFIGGKGVFKQSYTGNNVAGYHVFEKNKCIDYSEAALVSNAGDMPYWQVRENHFLCLPGASGCKGVVLGGLLDGCVIERNSFLRNDVHLQLGPLLSGSVHVRENDFISFESDRTDYDIWLIPNDTEGAYSTNVGQACEFVGNKFGNEGIVSTPASPRFLIAASDDPDRAVAMPDLDWKDGADGRNHVLGLTFRSNRLSTISPEGEGPGSSFMKICVEKVGQLSWAGDNVVEGPFDYLFEFSDPELRVADRVNTNWDVNLGAGMNGHDGVFLKYGIANAPIGLIQDPNGIWPSPTTSLPIADPFAVTIAQAVDASDWLTEADVDASTMTDPGGAPIGVLTTVDTPGRRIVLDLPDVEDHAGGIGWVVGTYTAGPAAAERLQIRVERSDHSQAQLIHNHPVRAGWTTVCASFVIPEPKTATALQLRITAPDAEPGANQFVLGKWKVAVGRSAPEL